MLFADCRRHGAGVVWVVCVHTEQIRSARRFEPSECVANIVGEALCPACLADAKDRSRGIKLSNESLRLACEACVLDRFPIEAAS